MLEWSEFGRLLARELAALERDTILIVRERDESRHYVQAMREPDRLYAEAVSNNFLVGPLLLTPADEEVMSEAGWRPPAEPAPRNWWTELPGGGLPGDFTRLADVMVTALRDVQGVRRPSELVYESFHRHGTGLIELPGFGIDIADPSRITRRRETPPEAAPEPAAADGLEPLLADAKERGDNGTYFSLLGRADLVLPATGPAVEDPDRAELPTITIGGGTYVTVFTSPGALARTGDRHPGLYRRTSFAALSAGWPDPAWQLAINAGLPSEVLLDVTALARLSAEHGSPSVNGEQEVPQTTIDAYSVEDLQKALDAGTPYFDTAPEPEPEPLGAPPHPAETAGVPIRPPHGTRLWRWNGANDQSPVAVYDAIGAVWAPARADAVPAPRTD
ncbi:SseB family protein [Actinomadura sp. LOL_016]|uniref:SseB family protein n=1 Tax=unclassified Actinomadura TaxID=2626254 RepID=UPI003A8131D4